MARKKPYEPKAFESARQGRTKRSEAFASIYHSMLTSPAYMDLTHRQRDLYTYCKLQYYGESPTGSPEFTMNRCKWNERYRLYSEGNSNAFYKDMEALINHGFVDCIFQGGAVKKKNRYRLSDRWRDFGTDKFKMPPQCMTAAMLRRIGRK